MNRTTLEQTLHALEEHVSDGIVSLDRLRALIVRLECAGADTTPTRQILADYEAAQARHLAERDRLVAQIAGHSHFAQ